LALPTRDKKKKKTLPKSKSILFSEGDKLLNAQRERSGKKEKNPILEHTESL
jgi:hypothetical protein